MVVYVRINRKPFKGKSVRRRRTASSRNNLSLADMIDASQVITHYVRGGTIDTHNCSAKAEKYIKRVVKKKSNSLIQELQKLNNAIIFTNASENKPTEAGIIAYKKLMNDQ